MAVGRRELMLGTLGMGWRPASALCEHKGISRSLSAPMASCLGPATRPQRCKTPLIKPQSPARRSFCPPATT